MEPAFRLVLNPSTSGVVKTAVWRRQGSGPMRDKTRPSRVKPLGPEVGERVLKHTGRSAGRDNPRDGQRVANRSYQRERRAPHLEGARPAAAPLAPVQALDPSNFVERLGTAVPSFVSP
jgi:hypothetical protein